MMDDDYWSWVPPTEDELREDAVRDLQEAEMEAGLYD